MTEILFKVIVIGDPTVGKTSLIHRYVNDEYRPNYKGTIGVDFALKFVKMGDNQNIKLQLWDIAGQERVTGMTRVYYKDADACIVMFDLSQRTTFLSSIRWKNDLDGKCLTKDGSDVPCLLLANKTLQYFSELKESTDGWKLCAQTYTSPAQHNLSDQARFFCLQVIEDFLKTRYTTCADADHQAMKSVLITCLQMDAATDLTEKSFLKNKVAQLFALAFTADYPLRWPTFAVDISQVINTPASVDMYLRIFLAVDSEIADKDMVVKQQVADRNTHIKDVMREHIITQLVDSFHTILVQYETTHPHLIRSCLDTIGAYVSWIDINLIANDRFVPLLIRFMRNSDLRENVCDCICEVIHKGMEAMAKVKLIESFDVMLNNAGLLDIKADEDGDYMLKLAKLINVMGVNLVTSYTKLSKSGDTTQTSAALVAIETKMSLFMRCLSDEDDDVSQAVAPFAQDYIALLKQNSGLCVTHRAHVERLMMVVIQKMKFDQSYNFEEMGEDEAEFMEYRKQMKTILCNLAQLDSSLLLTTTRDLVTRTLTLWKSLDYRDIELAVYMLFLIGEAFTLSSQLFAVDNDKSGPMKEMLTLLITSEVSRCGHIGVLLSYFEAVVRYDKFFNIEPQHIPSVVASFTDERGLRHTSPHIRSRATYLFSRFIKTVKQHTQTYLDDILARLTDLLTLVTPDNGSPHLLSPDDQLFVYETVGMLIITSPLTPQKKQSLMKELLSPIVTRFDDLFNKMLTSSDPNKQLQYAQCLNNAMSLASRSSKGFSSQQSMRECECTVPYTDMLAHFLHALDTPLHRQIIHSGVRQFLHRMVVCMGTDILPYIPLATENLLKSAHARELADFLPFLNQLIQKFKKLILPFLQDIFLALVKAITQELCALIDDKDSEEMADKSLLRRQYYGMLSTVVGQGITELFLHLDASDMEQVLLTVIQGADDCSDPVTQKSCFLILKRLIENWGTNNEVPGFHEFMYKRITPTCLTISLKPHFTLADAQTVLAVGECAACLKCMHDKRGEEMIGYLERDILPKLNLPTAYIYQFCSALKSDLKTFKSFFKDFCQKANKT